jgi:ADP-ribosylglycohydrolase
MSYPTQLHTALLALSVGDATGENQMKILPARNVEYKAGNVAALRSESVLWPWTDDTAMAIGVSRNLRKFGSINQVELAQEFARNCKVDPQRGYGNGTARLLFTYLYDFENWRDHSMNWWGANNGSKGNGSAMRDSIIGVWYGLDFERVVRDARLSAEVTHFHDEPIAGSIAVALAAAVVTHGELKDYWPVLLENTPAGVMRDAISGVSNELSSTNWSIVAGYGNGKHVTALDTVPFALWTAYQAIHKNLTFAETMDSIIEVGGDTDTVAAMVGGIIGNRILPTQDEIDRTEPLPDDV